MILMPRTSEPAFNPEFANALRGKHPRWRDGDRIGAEQTRVFQDHPGLQPDIVIRHPGGAPVIIETEYEPAHTVEDDARSRLGMVMAGSGDAVEQAIAIRVPDALRGDQGRLAENIATAEFHYCVFTHREGEPHDPLRWPEAGWLSGGIDDFAGLIEQTALSERRIAEGMRILEEGVSQAAVRLRSNLEHDRPGVLERIAEALHQEGGEQTSRMAMAIVANALTVHTSIAGAHDIPPLDELRGARGQLLKTRVLATWRRILHEINYWPIFRIASDVLLPIPNGTAGAVLERLHAVAAELDGIGVTSTQDLAGQMFGRLITDRKFLATFYTLPSSAALLAELAVSRLDADWSDAEAVKALRIADLACGTGVLLSAAYRAVAARHRRASGDDEALHQAMMEHALIGADIMPAATHLTASMLSSAHPTVTFGNTQVYTMPYGRQGEEAGDAIAIGSLDLIESDTMLALFTTGRQVLRGTGADEEAEGFQELVLPTATADLVIMNPPFTRPTNHAGIYGVPVPSFAGFATTDDEQAHMAAALKGIRGRLTDPAGDGNAGLASNFLDLAHQKVTPRGVLALVLPLTVISGGSWSAARRLLARHYRDVTVIALAATGQSTRAFSADTGIGEALIVAVKRDEPNEAGEDDGEANCPTLYVNLVHRPRSTVDAAEVARAIAQLPNQETGFIHSGDDEVGCYIRASLADGGCASLREPHVAAAALGLPHGSLRLPRLPEPFQIPIATLADLGERGLVHRDITGEERNRAGAPRGPFDIAFRRGGRAAYPMLWSHDADRERRLVVEPDSEGRVRPGRDVQAVNVWGTATRLHFNLDFRLNSQSLAACLTPERSIGGRAWPNFSVAGDARREEALALWANTTLGLICFWWIAGRQQQGRAILTISGLPALPVLDVRELDARQLGITERIFEDFRDWTFLPANEAYRDETRKALDRAVLCELLGLPETILEPLDVLREQWCTEPTVHGGKSTRPT